MKILVMVLALGLSVNSYALQQTSGATGMSVLLSFTSNDLKPMGRKAEALIKDANEFYLSGTVTAELSQEIRDIQEEFQVSQLEAVDILVDYLMIIIDSK